LVTETTPDAPFARTAEIVVALITENEDTGTPPKLTEDVPVKLVPLIVMVVPNVPEIGEKLVIVGGNGAVKIKPARLADPPGLVTVISPEAPPATTAVMVLEFTTE
jgi:hypothetical protein